MELQAITYKAGGQSFTGYMADGSRGRPAPGIVVAHEGGGLTSHTKQRARMLADLGYVAFAIDLFGMPEFELDRAKEIVRSLRADLPEFRRRVAAGLNVLTRFPNVDGARLAAIGFCFGGTAALELARSGAPLRCIVGFHAGLTGGSLEDNRAIRGKVLLCLAADDPVVTKEQRDMFEAEMREAGADWQVHLYGGVGHSFTNPEIDAWDLPGFRYDIVADRRSWIAMRNLFEEVLDPVA